MEMRFLPSNEYFKYYDENGLFKKDVKSLEWLEGNTSLLESWWRNLLNNYIAVFNKIVNADIDDNKGTIFKYLQEIKRLKENIPRFKSSMNKDTVYIEGSFFNQIYIFLDNLNNNIKFLKTLMKKFCNENIVNDENGISIIAVDDWDKEFDLILNNITMTEFLVKDFRDKEFSKLSNNFIFVNSNSSYSPVLKEVFDNNEENNIDYENAASSLLNAANDNYNLDKILYVWSLLRYKIFFLWEALEHFKEHFLFSPINRDGDLIEEKAYKFIGIFSPHPKEFVIADQRNVCLQEIRTHAYGTYEDYLYIYQRYCGDEYSYGYNILDSENKILFESDFSTTSDYWSESEGEAYFYINWEIPLTKVNIITNKIKLQYKVKYNNEEIEMLTDYGYDHSDDYYGIWLSYYNLKVDSF